MLLGNLIESRRSKRPLGLQGLLSFSLHLGLGAGLVTATRSLPPTGGHPPRETKVYLPLAPRRESRPAPPRVERSESSLPKVPTFAAPRVDNPPDSIVPLVFDGPSKLKPFSWDPGTTASCSRPCTPADGPVGTEVLGEDQVDETAQVVSQPIPRYPPILQAAGRSGRVTLEFIVDATGHVEPASVTIREGSDPGFAASATDAVLRSIFVAAKSKGHAVRQRMSQTISYRFNAR